MIPTLRIDLLLLLLASATAASARFPSSSVPEYVALRKQSSHPLLLGAESLVCGKEGADVELVSATPTLWAALKFAQNQQKPLQTPSKDNEPERPLVKWDRDPTCTMWLGALNAPLCVYTSSSFADGRGLVLFSTQVYADKFSKLPSFQTAGRDNTPEKNRKWTTKEFPGRGIGMVATEDIKKGTLITKATPLLLIFADVQKHLESMSTTESILAQGIRRMPKKSQELLMSLAKSNHEADLQIQDVVATNGFSSYTGGEHHIAVCPEPSRMNHNCAPNAIYHINHEQIAHITYAVRDIKAGEEITTLYIDPFLSREERQQALKEAFKFKCECDRCTRRGKFEGTKDRAEVIAKMRKRLRDWDQNEDWNDELGPPNIAMAEAFIKLFNDEGMDTHLATAYGLAAMAYSAEKNIAKAVQYAELAVKHTLMKDGDTGKDVHYLKELANKLKQGKGYAHWTWGMRGDKNKSYRAAAGRK